MSLAAPAGLPDRDAVALEHGGLWVEVGVASGLGRPEYRVGDFTSGLLGLKKPQQLWPYLVLTLEGIEQVACTRAVESGGGAATWNQRFIFPLSERGWAAAFAGLEMKLQAFDQRGVQAIIRGDPLIGEGVLKLEHAALREASELHVALRSHGRRELQGQVSVTAGLVAPRGSSDVIAASAERPLAQVARAVAQFLSEPGGTELLLDARPDVLKRLPEAREQELHGTLARWVARFCHRGAGLSGSESDEGALRQLGHVVRSAQEVAAMSVWWEEGPVDVKEITLSWVRNFFCLCSRGGAAALNEERLRRLLDFEGAADPEDPRGVLERLCASLPPGQPDEVVAAVAARLLEAERAQEEDIFTLKPIVEGGRLASGTAAVVLPAGGGGLRVFLYHAPSIRRWQAETKSDPCTREVLRVRHILPLS